MRNNDYTVESVDNALRLLLMLQSEGCVRLSAAAAELGVARSTAHRLLGTMIGRGFAVQDDQRRYLPGPAFVGAPTDTKPSTARLRAVAQAHLVALGRRSGETVHLMIREGAHVRFLDSVEASHALRIASRIGVTLPAHLTSGGKAMLADLHREDIKQLYRHEPDAPPLAPLLRTLETVRRQGYGTNIGESERGVTAVGVCVRAEDGSAIAALTVSAPSLRLPHSRIPEEAAIVREAAHDLQRELAG